ncbi:interferon-induced protein 44-like [Salarias fasciatus]|uniref:interferon-induced protein 44-like n=1 Tax=Salarias fasciatus TaxID=181472 RepID=UPI0011764A6D|nr:interferon-induced protein 44-like [Salarias fasciatus]
MKRFLFHDVFFGPPARQPSPSPPPSPTFDTEWRKLSWGDNTRDLQYARDYQPQREDVSQLRVMLYGPVGAGKSSFINSVSTTLRGRMSAGAMTGTVQSVEGQSLTKKYETHWIKRLGGGDYYKFVFNDIMGIEDGSGRGVHVNDIKLAMMGNVMENHKFNPVSPLSSGDPGYNQSPSPDDRIHVLVCILSANASEIQDSVLQKMRDVREAANDLGIPQLLIVTKVDEACPETQKSLRNVYRSKHVKKKMAEFSSKVGIPMNFILPVKNYSEEISTNPDVDTLILSILRLIIDFGDDFLEK